jgi:hypothetical protein
MSSAPDNYQAHFARRWGHLTQPHVRALAWLLDAPDLLDAADPHWQGKIAVLGAPQPPVARWLECLDHDPAPLLQALGSRPYTRLGLYAEKLMAFYFQAHGRLVAHGLQVRASRNDTVGEFDFLLEAGPDGLEHIEFATKFYLLDEADAIGLDSFVGPNLVDSLGAKMRKIVERQLALGAHPAAQALLTRPLLRARALVKGWLFYPAGGQQAPAAIARAHCRGFWCAQEELEARAEDDFVILPRLQWLAPFRVGPTDAVLGRSELAAALASQFEQGAMPVMVATLRPQAGVLVEAERAFIVPNDWRARSARRARPDR